MAERKDWFVRRKGLVKGPFLSAQITRNILLGRLRPDDELSLDELNWQSVSEHRELYPDVMQETPIDKEKLEVAKVQVDERVSDQRRQKEDMAQQRRRTRERRGDESEVMLLHRENRKVMDIQAALQAIAPSTQAASPLVVKMPQLNLSQWFLGQTLNATVTGRQSADTVTLQIQNQQIEAKTNPGKAINVGTQLKLVVAKQGDPMILRVLQQNSTKIIHEAKQQLLRESLPKQASMEKLTAVLNKVSNNISEAIKTLPTPIEQQFKKLIDNLPTKVNLNNEAGLKTAIKNSGIFLESKLLSEANNKNTEQSEKSAKQTTSQTSNQHIAKDLKSNLLQLANVITKHSSGNETINNPISKQGQIIPTVDTSKNSSARTENVTKVIDLGLKNDVEAISKQIETSIARIEVNQSKAVVTHDNQNPVWSIETPVKDKQNIDLLKLNIQPDRDAKSKKPSEQLWTTNLTINFDNIGSISARLSIIDKEVNATLWSENETLNELINDNLSLFNKQIERCGLSSGKIICLDEAPTGSKIPLSGNNLINITI